MNRDELRRTLAEIDRTSESVAVRAARDPEVQALAFAVHRLVVCVAHLANHVEQATSPSSVSRVATPSRGSAMGAAGRSTT